MNNHKKYNENHRVGILCVLFALVFCFLAGGLFYRQVVQYHYFSQKEKYQNQRRIWIAAPRGDIYDRNGKIIVCNKPIFDLHLYFSDIRQEIRQEYAKTLQEYKTKKIPIDRQKLQKQARQCIVQKYLDLANKITKRSDSVNVAQLERHYRESLVLPFMILSHLSTQEYIALVDQLPPSSPLYIATDYYRFYPYKSAACHVLGYINASHEIHKNTDDLRSFLSSRKVGKSGIELSKNETLSGTDGEEVFAVDPSGFRAECIHSKLPQKGQDCQLSLDIDLQIAVEKALRNRIGSAVVIEVNSGEVLAMANSPSYDVNLLSPKISSKAYAQITQEEAWSNRALQGCYPPASIFKIVSSIAFLRSHAASWDENDTIECTGKTKIGVRTFNCDHSTAHGSVSLATAMKKSCNVYYYLRSQSCGIKNIHAEAQRFHLDQKTGIELPFETTRMTIPTPDWKEKKGYGKWFPGDTANTAIGQGYLLFSPLQMCCFMASIAKNRTLTIPHILHKLSHRQATTPTIGLSKNDYPKLIHTLQQVIDSGTGRLAKLESVSIAGKSGTAQVWERGVRRNVAWFIGFAPVENPSIAIVVAVQEKTSHDNYYGGKTAAPLAKQILDFHFRINKN